MSSDTNCSYWPSPCGHDSFGPADTPAASQPIESWEGQPNYHGIEVLSPMVRASSLPLRLCSLHYGADLVYSGVTIDKRIIGAKRVVTEAPCGSRRYVDYVTPDEVCRVPAFSTCPAERGRVVFQLGTADPCLAVKVALTVCQDVRGIDVMGCTLPFSTKAGMGSDLLNKPEFAADILKTLRRELPSECALLCKIQILGSTQKTRDFLQMAERSRVNAIAVHCRTKDQDPDSRADWGEMQNICDAVSIPVIANGSFLYRAHISDFWKSTEGVDRNSRPAATMIARGALWNPAIFASGTGQARIHNDGGIGSKLVMPNSSYDDAVRRYLRTAISVRNDLSVTKWVLLRMLLQAPGESTRPRFEGMGRKEIRRLRNGVESAKSPDALYSAFKEPSILAT